MKFLRVVPILVTVFLLLAFFPLAAVGLDHSIDLKKIQFQWSIEGKNIHIHLKGKTKGWVAIGFNPTKAMKNANIIIGYVKKGKVKISDDFGTQVDKHKPDKKLGGRKNMSKVTGSEKNGVTSLQFTIPLDSKDKKDRVIDPKSSTIVLLATGKRDSFRFGHNFVTALDVNLETGKFQKR